MIIAKILGFEKSGQTRGLGSPGIPQHKKIDTFVGKSAPALSRVTRQDDALEAMVRGGIQSTNKNNSTMLLRLVWVHPPVR